MINSMRATITVNDGLFAEADRRAEDLGISRSGFYQRALEHYLERLRADDLTERMNRVIDRHGDDVDPDYASHIAEVWAQDLGDDEW
jgi:hypothetical protein